MEFKETRLGFTIGDVNGIGLETFIKAFGNEQLFDLCTIVLYGSANAFKYYAKELESELRYNLVKSPDDCVPGKINLVEVDVDVDIQPGKPSEDAGKLALKALEAAVEGVKNGFIHNIVTLPIDKNTIQSDQFNFAGHTDFLAKAFEVEDYMMILTSEDLRVGVVTGHIPITQVASRINKDTLSSKIRTMLHTLRFDFAVQKPKIAVLGLNPHSGDNGLIGKEEEEILKPVIAEYVGDGELVYGPYPADGFFGTRGYKDFDAVLAMYHDQGLVPFKQIAFSDGVNYTAGLPIVRTSPDHGTAYNIAGKGIADPGSLINAMFTAKKIYNNRVEFNELNKNPLGFKSHRREKFSIGVPNLK